MSTLRSLKESQLKEMTELTRQRLLNHIERIKKIDPILKLHPKTTSDRDRAASCKKHIESAEKHARNDNRLKAEYHLAMYHVNSKRGNL